MKTIKILLLAALLSGCNNQLLWKVNIDSDVLVTAHEMRETRLMCWENGLRSVHIIRREPDGTLVIVGDDGNEYGVNVNCCEK